MFKKSLKILLSLVIALGTLALTSTKVEAAEKEYEIYPNPHSLTYQDGNFIVRGEVNIVYDNTIDTSTKNRLEKILKSKDKKISVSNKKDDSKTNVFIGTYQSEGEAYKYANANYSLETSLFSKYSGHQVISNNGEIVVIGKDTDAAFYGITSLKHIFNQIDGSTLRNFTIKDYADTDIRGFIEGYYGIPWSNEDRMSLMEFGGEFKMTAYIFAPKDDPYHKDLWRDLYPADQLAEMRKLVQTGEESKCSLVWTAHPFMGGFDANKADEEIEALIKKFEQLYSIGVRQFGVLGDDVGSLDRSIVIKMMTRVSEWGKSKGDVLDPVFCPAGYNHSWQAGTIGDNYNELNDYDFGFPEDVQIFWTGEAVCEPVEQKTITHFKTYNLREGMTTRRNPLFWLNWPVNDINGARLMMGKGSLLRTDININELNGVVTNPMQEAEASKPALFAVADYSWNVKGFDDEKSWADSFKYIDEDAGEYLYTLAKHMSNPEPNGHGLVLAESEELKPLITEFKNALSNKNASDIKTKGTQLIKEMEVIVEACDGFQKNSKNANLKEEMKPFIGSLKDLSLSISNFIKATIALNENDSITAVNSFTNGTANYSNSQKHKRQLLNGTANVTPGSTELIPLAETIQKAIAADINKIVSGEGETLKITASSSLNSIYDGKLESIIDGNVSTYVWYQDAATVGQYFQLDLSVPTTIYGVEIANGKSEGDTDTFKQAKLKYSTDNGNTWKDISNEEYGEYATTVSVKDIKLENVTNVRYECTADGDKWVAMREFSVLTSPSTTSPYTAELLDLPEGWSVYDGRKENILDNNESTGVEFAVRWGGDPGDTTIAGDYLGVKLSQPIILGKIKVLQGANETTDNYFTNVDLEYSMNGTDWIKIETYKNQRIIDIDLSDQNITAQYVRLKNNANQHNWIGMREFQVNAKVFFNGTAYTNVEAYKTVKVNYLDNNNYFEATQNITLEKDDYIGFKLKRVHELSGIITDITNSNLTVEVSKNGYEWSAVHSGELQDEACYIRLINKTNSAVTFDINEFKVNTNEVEDKKLSTTNGFGIYQNTGDLNVFDNDWTSQTVYEGSQNQGSYFVYDLGQTIDLETFKAVCRDGEGDFPRHGKFSVSVDGKNWTEIMTLGNQDSDNPGESTGTDNINYVLPVHEISYNTKESTNINQKARYIKFEITRTKSGDDKWVRFQEFVINGGELLPVENNPTIQSTSKETANGFLKNMLDGDLSTMFVPADKSGSLTYTITDKNDQVNSLKIIQDSNNISNAVVSVRVLNEKTRSENWVELGRLSQTINEFVLPENNVVLDVKIEWKDTELAISQLQINRISDTTVNKDALTKLLEDTVDTSTWTTNTKAAYDQAITVGKEVEQSSVSQSSVDSAVTMIKNALTNKAIKGDATSLQAAIDNAITVSAKYTATTWKVYSKTVDSAKTAIANKDNLTQTEIDDLIQDIESGKNQLVFNPTSKELAILASEDIQKFIDSVVTPKDMYTVNSFKALTDAKKELDNLITLNETKEQDPDTFATAREKVEKAKMALVGVGNIPTLVKEFATVTESIYTVESYKAYKDAIDKAQTLLIDGTAETIASVEKEVVTAKDGLILLADSKDAINQFIKDLEKLSREDYTTKSYTDFLTVIDDIKGNIENATNAELAMFETQLKTAKNNLVSIASLKLKVNQAKALDANQYTTSSYAVVKIAIENATKLYEAGSTQQVADALSYLDKSIQSLKIRVNKEEAKSYIQSLTKVSGEAYTLESYTKYSKAFDTLTSMINHLENVSAEEYLQAKTNLEKAFSDLVLKKVEVENPDTGDHTYIGVNIGLGLLTLALMVALRKKGKAIQ